jgi:hypothetical protein
MRGGGLRAGWVFQIGPCPEIMTNVFIVSKDEVCPRLDFVVSDEGFSRDLIEIDEENVGNVLFLGSSFGGALSPIDYCWVRH